MAENNSLYANISSRGAEPSQVKFTESDTSLTRLKFTESDTSLTRAKCAESDTSLTRVKFAESDTSLTRVKFIDTSYQREVSESSEDGIPSTRSMLLSGNSSDYLERARSAAPAPPPRKTSLISTSSALATSFNQNRPLPSTPRSSLSSSSSRRHHQQRRRRSHSHSNSDEQEMCLKRRHLAMITIISLAVGIASCGVSALTFIFNVGPVIEENTFKDGDYEVCVPCAHLDTIGAESRYLRGQLATRQSSNDSECCARNAGQTSALVQLILNRQKNITGVRPPPTRKRLLSPVSAHIHLFPWDGYKREDDRNCLTSCELKLTPGNYSAQEHARHVVARNTSLKIMYSGWYMVYSNIYFKQKSGVPCSREEEAFRHYIARKNLYKTSRNTVLAESSHSCCNGCQDDHHTSYTGGIFQLEAEDHIYVNFTGNTFISYDGHGSYLGLVMLSSSNSSFNGGSR